ncbi:MAG: DUF6807 family protein, partial [Bryobacteraceae bacterium]
MSKLLWIAALACILRAGEPLKWVQYDSPAAYDELREGSQPVLRYNYATLLAPGAPAKLVRCCYVYPLWTPAGVSLLDDFPKDHPHHRGLFWAWPYVETAGSVVDGWSIEGLKLENTGHSTGFKNFGELATMNVDNVWVAGGKRIAAVHERYAIHASDSRGRSIEIELMLTALDAPITLKGSHEAPKSYGGLNVRFAPREQTVIRTEAGVSDGDQDLNPHSWAELEALYNGHKAALRIDNDPSNPGGTPQWTL